MADRDLQVDQATDSGDGPGGGSAPSGGGASGPPGAKDGLGTKGGPSGGAGGSPDGSVGPPPSGAPDGDPLGDPKDGPPTVVDDGGIGGEGLVGAGGDGGGGSGGLLGGLADAYDEVEDLAHETYDDVEEEVAETYEDASKLDHSGEHWGGVAGTPDEVINDGLDIIDPDHRLEEFNRGANDAIDETARHAGDAFRDAGATVDGLYDDSGVEPVIDDAREAGAVVVPSVVEDLYDQSEDLAHRTYGDIEEEVVETYEDASTLDGQGEHWGGMAGTPDHWVEPFVDGAENIAEAPEDWYDKSGVGDFGSGAGRGSEGDSGVPGVDDYGRGAESDPLEPLAPVGGADETAELAGEEEALRLTAAVDALTADPGPLDIPDDPIEAVGALEPQPADEVDELIEPV